jgi:excisionase family DNA binding protein
MAHVPTMSTPRSTWTRTATDPAPHDLAPEVVSLIPPGLLTPDEAAHYLRTTVEHLRSLRRAGTGPSFVKVGRLRRYRREDLDGWAAAQRIVTRPSRPR